MCPAPPADARRPTHTVDFGRPRADERRSLLALTILMLGAGPLAAQQVYPGVDGEPDHLDVSCLCSPETPPSGTYGMSTLAPRGGMTTPEPVEIRVTDCGRRLTIDVTPGPLVLTAGQRGDVRVYEGDYQAEEGTTARLTLVVSRSDGLAFEPAVVMELRGEAVPHANPALRIPMSFTLQELSDEAADACECALTGRYYERMAQYREIFSDASLIEEARRQFPDADYPTLLAEYKALVIESYVERRTAFDRSLGRTEADDIPGGGGSTSPDGTVTVHDVEMLDAGVPPVMIESVHVHEGHHQDQRLDGVELASLEVFAAEEVEAAELQLQFLGGWLRGHCPRWQPPLRVF